MVHIFRKCVILTVTIYIFPLVIYAQTAAYETLVPFKVGTFEIDGIPKVALVLRDRLIVILKLPTVPWNVVQAILPYRCPMICLG